MKKIGILLLLLAVSSFVFAQETKGIDLQMGTIISNINLPDISQGDPLDASAYMSGITFEVTGIFNTNGLVSPFVSARIGGLLAYNSTINGVKFKFLDLDDSGSFTWGFDAGVLFNAVRSNTIDFRVGPVVGIDSIQYSYRSVTSDEYAIKAGVDLQLIIKMPANLYVSAGTQVAFITFKSDDSHFFGWAVNPKLALGYKF